MGKNGIKLLDCTLRDGGYVIDWMFGEKAVKAVLQNLHGAGVDYIEGGFLKECKTNSDKTFYNSIREIEDLAQDGQNYTLMINCGEYSADKIYPCDNKNIKIRVAFKKHNQEEALKLINSLKAKGWDVFANPMSTNTYSKEELSHLTEKINLIKPYGLSIVDTLGNMYEKDVTEIFSFIDENLDSEISLGFHSHNSLQLSFSNTKTLLKMGLNREIIIDSCLYGMGRGAGNLCTELITKYLNDNYNTEYDIKPILKTISEIIKPIYNTYPWGYSTPYYIAALHGCHPNYASYLVEKGFNDSEIDAVLTSIPNEKKSVFDKTFVQSL